MYFFIILEPEGCLVKSNRTRIKSDSFLFYFLKLDFWKNINIYTYFKF